MQDALESLEYPEFRPSSANPFYNIPTGLQSPYGDQLITMLESLVASNGKLYRLCFCELILPVLFQLKCPE